MVANFGTLANGEVVQRVEIGDGFLTVSLLTYGASIQSIRMAGCPFSLCLGFDTLDGYLTSRSYFGAIVGRVVNRIGNGQAVIDGTPHVFDRNEAGRHTLHGGAHGIGRRVWKITDADARSATLSITDPDGANGFPGTLSVAVRYEVKPGGILAISLQAETDAATLCNLAPHPYFNLNGAGDARAQILQVEAVCFLETDAENIPTGKLIPVAGTRWDHRTGQIMLDSGLAYDTNFCLSGSRQPLRRVARLSGLESGISLNIETTEPGLQVYDGSGLSAAYSGIALEPQGWIDAANNPDFPGTLLRPGAVSRQLTQLVFE